MSHRLRHVVARLTPAVALLFAGAVVASATPTSPAVALATTPSVALHPTGARPSELVTTARAGVAAAALPATVDLRAWAEPVGDQGAVGSCTTWAFDYAMLGWYSRHDGIAGEPFAPMYTYSQVRIGWDGGAYMRDVLNAAVAQGSDTRAHYQGGNADPGYFKSYYDFWDQPTASERASAATHRVPSTTTLFSGGPQGTSGQAAIQSALATGKPVSITFPVRHGFDVLGPSNSFDDDISSAIRGYHEILALGYDATGLLIENSWGTGWGASGFGRLSWRVVQNDVREAYTISGFGAPSVTGLSVNRGPATGGTAVTITGTALSSTSSVSFGSVRAARVSASNGTLTATSPVGVPGTVDVRVTTAAGTSALTPADRFTYWKPGADPHATPASQPRAGLALRDGSSGYVLSLYGPLYPVGLAHAPGAPATNVSSRPSSTQPPRRGVTLTPDGTGGYVVDGAGGFHPFGVGGHAAPAAVRGALSWPGRDVVRGVALLPNGTGGYVLDGSGGLHAFAVGRGAMPATAHGTSSWPGRDVARGLVIAPDGTGGYVVDLHGGLHPFRIGANAVPGRAVTSGSWPTSDAVRGISLVPGTRTGEVMDLNGYLHPFHW